MTELTLRELVGVNENSRMLLKKFDLDYFFALVDDAGNVALEDREALAAAESRSTKVIRLTLAEIKSYFPNRLRSFNLVDATLTELAQCRDVAIEGTRDIGDTLSC